MNVSIRKAAAGEQLDPTYDFRPAQTGWRRATYNDDMTSRSLDVPLAPLVGSDPVLNEAARRSGVNREAGWGQSETRWLPSYVSHLIRTET